MRKDLRCKRRIVMTEMTILGSWYMACRLHHRWCVIQQELVLVAAFTTVDIRRMDIDKEAIIQEATGYSRVGMALTALLLCRYVIRYLGDGARG